MTAGARRLRFRAAWAVLVGIAAGLAVACSRDRTPEAAHLSLTGMLAGTDTAGYARALEPRPFTFPADHGPHPDFRTEWWYITGSLDAQDGRAIGFQLTFFRNALAPRPPESPSAWATNQAYMAHFALTDVRARAFHAYERFDRGALGLAGGRDSPFRVWVGDWFLASMDSVGMRGAGDASATASDGTFPLRLHAASADVAIDLVLRQGKPVVLQGNQGLSQKGPEPGNASYYYSFTRMPAGGTVRLGADTLAVSGLAWLDREWSTSALSDGLAGWDWFALQLDDGWDLMVYRLRADDGSATPFSEGVLVGPDGTSRRLAWDRDVQVESTGRWTAPDGSVYPSGWRVRVPARGWDLDVEPELADQELKLAFRYWEGAVRVRAHEGALPIQGRGYVELTGYAGVRPQR